MPILRGSRIALVFLFLSAGLGAVSCATSDDMANLEEEIDSLNSSILSLQDELTNMESTVSELEGELESVQDQQIEVLAEIMLAEQTPVHAYFSLNEPGSGYSYIKADGGPGLFLMSLDDAEPYRDGYRLNLRIGNPFEMTYSGFTLTAYERGESIREASFTDELRPGAWNRISFVVAPIEASLVSITITTDEVSLWR